MIGSTNRKAGPFTGNGAASTFPFAFKVFTSADVEVVQNDTTSDITTLALSSNYSVSLNADQDNNPGGSITLTAGPLATGYGLIITSDVAGTQQTNLLNGGGFYPEVIVAALDRLTILVQQLQEQVNLCLQLPVTDTGAGADLPAATSRAGKYLGFDSNGAPVTVPIVTVTPSFGIAIVPFSATPTFNAALGSVLKITLTGNVNSSAFATGAGVGTFISVRIVQDATGGRTFTWPSNMHNAGVVNTDPSSVSDQLFAVDVDGSARAVGPIMYS